MNILKINFAKYYIFFQNLNLLYLLNFQYYLYLINPLNQYNNLNPVKFYYTNLLNFKLYH